MDEVIDLTLTLRHGMRGVDIETRTTFERDGWNSRTLRLYSHAGTHMDAQVHFAAGPGTIDRLPLERCMGPAWVADIPAAAPNMLIGVEHLAQVEAALRPGEGLLLRTGWSAHAADLALYREQAPRVSESLARWCVERRVKLLGVEPPSVAAVLDREELTRIHRILLAGGVTIVEGLANLDALVEPRVFFVAAPLKVEEGDGSPCRAFAIPRWSGR